MRLGLVLYLFYFNPYIFYFPEGKLEMRVRHATKDGRLCESFYLCFPIYACSFFANSLLNLARGSLLFISFHQLCLMLCFYHAAFVSFISYYVRLQLGGCLITYSFFSFYWLPRFACSYFIIILHSLTLVVSLGRIHWCEITLAICLLIINL